MIVEDMHRSGFGVVADCAGEQALLAVRGTVDASGAPVLGAFIDAAIASGYPSVVVDLAATDGIAAPGMTLLVRAASRLAASEGQLTVRASPGLAWRMRAMAGPAHWLEFELASGDPERLRLGPEQSRLEPGAPVSAPAPDLVRELRQMNAIPAGDDVVDGALRLVVALAGATVEGADGVSVSLRRNGQLSTVAASDQTILEMDADQYATGEGPCVDASVKGHWFHVNALDDERRWPAFIPRAKELGINAILSTPLLASDHPVGALNIYSRTAEAFAPKDQELASVFATEASLVLTDAGAGASGGQLAARLGAALRIRQIIAQAQGVVMERERISADAAYGLLRDFSQGSNQPLFERAEDVVASTQRPRSDPAAGSDRTPGIDGAAPARGQPGATAGPQRADRG